MTRRVFNKLYPAGILAVCLAESCLTVTPSLKASEVQVRRHSLLSATPTEAQADLLATTVTVQIPECIQSVTAKANDILQKVARANRRLSSKQNEARHYTSCIIAVESLLFNNPDIIKPELLLD
jgi:hypothetical protein